MYTHAYTIDDYIYLSYNIKSIAHICNLNGSIFILASQMRQYDTSKTAKYNSDKSILTDKCVIIYIKQVLFKFNLKIIKYNLNNFFMI